ncbi:type I CRISPR-associated protein Cas7 [Metallosphaera hakonensis]|uniref:type I CRISPR-associated protein Cas7 n=1 Tax=Metallosphaera hakonensis TaxID=79601 RepID=UPI00278C3F75|nr:type I CRISPR-associated protein Cas7 [Metallosphaera hakonensis]
MAKCIDARLFGATIPEKGEQKGKSTSFTGPVQFTWGYSLHKVDMVDSRSITSLFSGRDTGYGNIGKDYRVYYSLIAFHGAVSAKRAEITGASEEDLKTLDNSLWDSLVTETVTRSKLGQRPLLYLRVEYSSPEKMKGDLRRFVKVKEKSESVRDLTDLEVNLDALVNLVSSNDVIKVVARCSDDFKGFCEQVKSACDEGKKNCIVG